MNHSTFTSEQLASYHREGYFLARGLFAADEITKLLEFAQQDPAFVNSLYGRRDGTGRETKLALWNEAGNSLYSMFARSTRIVDRGVTDPCRDYPLRAQRGRAT
jgi:hypothetical protein